MAEFGRYAFLEGLKFLYEVRYPVQDDRVVREIERKLVHGDDQAQGVLVLRVGSQVAREDEGTHAHSLVTQDVEFRFELVDCLAKHLPIQRVLGHIQKQLRRILVVSPGLL